MNTISRCWHCNFNAAGSSSSLQTRNPKGTKFPQRMLHHVTNSTLPRVNLNLQVCNVKVTALQNKFCSDLGSGSAAKSRERVGENVSTLGNDVLCASSKQDSGSQAPKALSRSEELLRKLKRFGVAGVLSYGLLNTFYYLGAFLFVWFYVAPAPGGMGYIAAAQRFLKILAIVWAGSQVTKLLRAGGALAVAPFVDQGLLWFTAQFKFKSRGSAFGAIVIACIGLALSLFITITLLWA